MPRKRTYVDMAQAEPSSRRPARETAMRQQLNAEALRLSGTNPNDHKRHREANTQRATNHQRESRK